MRYPDILNVPGIRGPSGLTIEQIAELTGKPPSSVRISCESLTNRERLETVPDASPRRFRVRVTGRNLLTMPWRKSVFPWEDINGVA